MRVLSDVLLEALDTPYEFPLALDSLLEPDDRTHDHDGQRDEDRNRHGSQDSLRCVGQQLEPISFRDPMSPRSCSNVPKATPVAHATRRQAGGNARIRQVAAAVAPVQLG